MANDKVCVSLCVRAQKGGKKPQKGLNDGNHCKEGENWIWQQDQIKTPQERRNEREREREKKREREREREREKERERQSYTVLKKGTAGQRRMRKEKTGNHSEWIMRNKQIWQEKINTNQWDLYRKSSPKNENELNECSKGSESSVFFKALLKTIY